MVAKRKKNFILRFFLLMFAMLIVFQYYVQLGEIQSRY